MPKHYHSNHETDKKAVYQLGGKMTDCGWIFRNQTESDYGIDAEWERCNKVEKVVTGEIVKVQIKGTEKMELTNKGSMIAFNLDTDDLVYLCVELTVTPLLVVVDVTTEKAYWFDVKEQGPGLLKKKPRNKQHRLTTLLSHEITPQNADRLYEHVRRAEYLTFRQGLARQLTEKELATALLDVGNLQNEVAPAGHRVLHRSPNTYHAPGTVMSISEGETALDLVQTEIFKPGDEIKVKMLMEFPNDEDARKAQEELRRHMMGGTPTIDLQKYVKSVKVAAGDRTIADMNSARVHLGPCRTRTILVLRSKKTGEQLSINGEAWGEPGKFSFDSTPLDGTQAIHLRLISEIASGSTSFQIALNRQNISSFRDAAYVMSVLESFNGGMEMLLDEKGIQRKIADTSTSSSSFGFGEKVVDLVRRLAVIEEKGMVRFPFEKLEGITTEEVDNVTVLSSLLTGGSATVPITLEVTPESDAGFTPDGQYVRIESPEELQFSILGQQVKWTKGVIAEGKCERSSREPDEGKMRVKMYVPGCSIRSMKVVPEPLYSLIFLLSSMTGDPNDGTKLSFTIDFHFTNGIPRCEGPALETVPSAGIGAKYRIGVKKPDGPWGALRGLAVPQRFEKISAAFAEQGPLCGDVFLFEVFDSAEECLFVSQFDAKAECPADGYASDKHVATSFSYLFPLPERLWPLAKKAYALHGQGLPITPHP